MTCCTESKTTSPVQTVWLRRVGNRGVALQLPKSRFQKTLGDILDAPFRMHRLKNLRASMFRDVDNDCED